MKTGGRTTQHAGLKGRAGIAVAVLVIGTALVLARAQAGAGFRTVAVVVLAVGWAALWTLAAVGAGRPLVRRLVPAANRTWEDDLLAVIVGAGVLTACAAGLSVAALFRPLPLLLVVVLWALAGALILRLGFGATPRFQSAVLPLVVIAGVALLVAATVSVFYDQWHQHLGFPWIWLQGGTIHPLQRNWYSFMPVNSSLLYAYGLRTLGPWSAQVVHWWSGVVMALTIAALARQSGSRSAALWALWIVATTPTVLHLATTAGTDLMVGMFAGGAWLSLLRTENDRGQTLRWWLLAGVLAGLAVGTKYTAIGTVAIPIAVGAIVLHRPWSGVNAFSRLVRGSAAATAAAVAVFAPWALRNLVATGNPFFPFVNGMFRHALKVPFEAAEQFAATLSGFDLSPGHLIGGLDLGTFRAPLDGFPSIGLAYLPLIGVAAVWAVWRRLPGSATPALAASALAGMGFWLMNLHVDRYLVPVLVPATAVLAVALATTVDAASRKIRIALVALVGLAFAWNLSVSVSRIGLQRLGCTLGVEQVEPLLAHWVSSFPAFQPVSELPSDAKVLLVAEARAVGFERPVELGDPYGESRLEELARTSRGAREMAEILAAEGITHVLANRWEADRAAKLQDHTRYFDPADPLTARRLDDFARECLEPMWNDRGVFLYHLVPECDVPPPGAGNLARW